MENQILIGLSLIAAMILLVALARRLQLPYPILLVVAGLGISFIPGLPHIELNPSLIFVLFLPPILQLSAVYTPMRDFRANLRAISFLAIGLVLATTIVVAVVAHIIIRGLPWAAAFALGAIVAPPDAVAATSIAQRLKLPRQLVIILEGESLLNDATSLVAYRIAVNVVLYGTFSLLAAGWQFLLSSIGGILVGVSVVLILTPLYRRLINDIPVYLILSFLSGYAAYILADSLHVSGVLAVVALGTMYILPRFNTMTPELRIPATSIWDIVVFLLNGLIFMLIGLQLPGIIDNLQRTHLSLVDAIWYAFIICFTLIVVRFAWVFSSAYIARLLARRKTGVSVPSWRNATILAWTGMRGVVSLASALALPISITSNNSFPQRDLIIFLTFCVIFVTLVFQGLSLPFLVQHLRIESDDSEEREENKARLKAALAGQARLKELVAEERLGGGLATKLQNQYEVRIRRFSSRYHGEQDGSLEERFTNFARAEQDLLEAENAELIELRNTQVINDETMRRVQRDLDLEWLRLQDN